MRSRSRSITLAEAAVFLIRPASPYSCLVSLFTGWRASAAWPGRPISLYYDLIRRGQHGTQPMDNCKPLDQLPTAVHHLPTAVLLNMEYEKEAVFESIYQYLIDLDRLKVSKVWKTGSSFGNISIHFPKSIDIFVFSKVIFHTFERFTCWDRLIFGQVLIYRHFFRVFFNMQVWW